MIGLLFFIIVVAALGVFALASMRWGVDSRTSTSDERSMSLFAR